MAVLQDLPELYKVKGDAVKSREIYDSWVKRYKKVFEQLIGAPVSDTAEEIMTAWFNTVQMNQAAMGLMWNPWIQAMPQLKEYSEKLMKGDWSALSEGRSLWREVYDETLGRVFRMPAFGLTKEHTEKVRRTYDAFIQFLSSLPYFYQYFYNTGMTALKEAFAKIQNLKYEEATPEAMREIYKIWLTTNENAFFELFKSPEFSNAMGEVLNYGLRLKKRLDELSAEWCEAMSIPSNREFDAMAKAIQDLRRKARAQQKAIEALQQKLADNK
jgi:class III poly(R)-hydroxyalkanoic acid synthase PhaE subunit